jgi:hypothetical protein
MFQRRVRIKTCNEPFFLTLSHAYPTVRINQKTPTCFFIQDCHGRPIHVMLKCLTLTPDTGYLGPVTPEWKQCINEWMENGCTFWMNIL